MNIDILTHIVCCDPRMEGITADGKFVLVDREDGTEIHMTPQEYEEAHEIGIDEEFYAILDMAVKDIKGTTIQPTGAMVDILLDLRHTFSRYRQNVKETRTAVFQSYRGASLRSLYYSEKYGEVSDEELDEFAEAYFAETDEEV